MNITDIRIFPVGDAKLKAFVSIILDHSFLISGIKVIEGNHGLFLSMPSKKRKDGTFKDIAHPLNQDTRTWMEKTIIAKYEEVLKSNPEVAPVLDVHGEEIGRSAQRAQVPEEAAAGLAAPEAPAISEAVPPTEPIPEPSPAL
jgi:stage V sporulation protein G